MQLMKWVSVPSPALEWLSRGHCQSWWESLALTDHLQCFSVFRAVIKGLIRLLAKPRLPSTKGQEFILSLGVQNEGISCLPALACLGGQPQLQRALQTRATRLPREENARDRQLYLISHKWFIFPPDSSFQSASQLYMNQQYIPHLTDVLYKYLFLNQHDYCLLRSAITPCKFLSLNHPGLYTSFKNKVKFCSSFRWGRGECVGWL